MAKLGEVCLINPKSCALRDDTEVSFVPMTKVGERGEFDASEIKHYSEVKKGFTNFQNDDILFAKITPCMENGKGAIAQNMKNGVGFGSTEFHVLRPDTDKITSEWLYYLTTWKTFRKEAERNMTGSAGQKRVPKTFLENYVVNLPEIDTQKNESKILRKVDDLISLRKQQLAKLDELVKARFVKFFYGQGYPVLKWKDVFDTTTGKLDSNAAVEKGIYPFFTCSKEVLRIDKYAFEQKALLLAGNNAAGRYDVKYYDGRFNAYQRTYVLRLKENWSYRVFQYQLEDKLEYLQQQSLGGLTKYLTLKILGELDFIIPPKDKQGEFDTFVERVDQQKQSVQQSLEKLELLKKALMQEYFG